ncbi:MAG TPA: rhodanese-like domain-containing protein [Egibacteraceae bacterium]|nr:rhodanese-like domain-containing protein [Egibacteraceae bacterium]
MTTTQPGRVDASTVRDWLERPDPVTVLDVRSPAEFETAHIPGSVTVPLNLIANHAGDLAARLDRQVVLVCQAGTRATQAQQHLAAAGADHLHILDGGIAAYTAAGGEVIRRQARWSLERQVRLVAGSLVLAGLTLGLRIPKARLIAGGVGTGLTLSALTDTCTMGRLLAALPYNRGPQDRSPDEVLAQIPTGPQP